MHLNFLFKKDNDNISKKGKVNVPDGLFTKCPKCSKMILTDELFLDNCVCHSCGYYFENRCENKNINGYRQRHV